MEISVLLMDQPTWRDELKYVSVAPGELCVMTAGPRRTLMLCADNLDTPTQVLLRYKCVSLYIIIFILFRCRICDSGIFWSGYCSNFA